MSFNSQPYQPILSGEKEQQPPPHYYPQQQQSFPPQQPNPPFNPSFLSDDPSTVTCPHCNNVQTTLTQKKSGLFTWIAAFACCFVGCCCIPFLIEPGKDTEHVCSQCHRNIGTKK
eukprot:Pgem_evm1s779